MKIVEAVGNVQLMQKINRLKVLEFIRKKGVVARPEISKATGLSPSSITNIVSYLLENKLVVEVGAVDSKEVGRKAILLKFNPAAFNIISVNIEVTQISIALTDLDGDIIKLRVLPLERTAKDQEALAIIQNEISLLIGESRKLTNVEVAAIGIGVSGLVQDDDKLIISSSLRWKRLSLKEYFENSFKLPVYVQNNSRTKALSEFIKDRVDVERNVIFLDLTMGVGVINFFEGKINEAVIGELGHTTVKKDGPVCFCGNHGCLEVMCSVESILEQCKELLVEGGCGVLAKIIKEEGALLSYDSVLKAFKQGDTDVKTILKECGEYLGLGIANIINMFNPERIIINGDVLLASEFIYETAVSEANKRAYEQFTDGLKYEKVNIGIRQAVKGVTLYVSSRLFDFDSAML